MGLLDATESDSFLKRWAARLLIILLVWVVIGAAIWAVLTLAIGRPHT
jgi:hypothetical protein